MRAFAREIASILNASMLLVDSEFTFYYRLGVNFG